MGSLPPPSLDLPFPPPKHNHHQIEESTLLNLFKSQQDHLNYFFRHLDLSQALSFTHILLNSTGTIFFSGIGKSGFVANKISQTLVSLGIRASFLNPVDALHGDIGALSSLDVLVLFSKSGNTEELLRLVPCARAKAIQMVFGDTVAIALMGARNLTKEQYATNHPAGRIGKSLIFKVKDVMKKQNELPICKEGDLIMDQLVELTSKGCGCLLVIDPDYQLIGTFTDGDLRRTLKASGEGIFKLTVGEMCNRKPRTVGPDSMAVEAMKKMESPPSPVQFLPVVNDENVLIGIITLHGLVSAGL
ncbi:Probable arabinose 5-phosphate isomerase [Linum perenne]